MSQPPEPASPADPILDRAATLLERGSGVDEFVAALDDTTLQRLLGSAIRAFARRVETCGAIAPFVPGGQSVPTATELCIATSRMLDALSVEVFELAMWNTWGAVGRPRSEVVHDA